MTKITGGPSVPILPEPTTVSGTDLSPSQVKSQTPPPSAADAFALASAQHRPVVADGGPKLTSAELHGLLSEIAAKDLGEPGSMPPAPAYTLSLPEVSKIQGLALALPADDLHALRGLKPQLGSIADPHLQRALREVCDLAEGT